MACLHHMTARELDGMFPDDNACKAYLASRRWPDKVRCPRCGNPKVYRLRGFTWQCQACNSKGYQFSVPVGTIFENTKISLKDWLRTIHLMLTKRNEDREKTVSASTSTRPRNWGEDARFVIYFFRMAGASRTISPE